MAVDTTVEVDKLDQVEVAVKLIEAAPTDIFFQLADVGTFEVAHRVPEVGLQLKILRYLIWLASRPEQVRLTKPLTAAQAGQNSLAVVWVPPVPQVLLVAKQVPHSRTSHSAKQVPPSSPRTRRCSLDIRWSQGRRR